MILCLCSSIGTANFRERRTFSRNSGVTYGSNELFRESSDHLENSRTCRGNFLSSQKVFVDRRLHHLVARFCNVNYVMNRNDVIVNPKRFVFNFTNRKSIESNCFSVDLIIALDLPLHNNTNKVPLHEANSKAFESSFYVFMSSTFYHLITFISLARLEFIFSQSSSLFRKISCSFKKEWTVQKCADIFRALSQN